MDNFQQSALRWLHDGPYDGYCLLAAVPPFPELIDDEERGVAVGIGRRGAFRAIR